MNFTYTRKVVSRSMMRAAFLLFLVVACSRGVRKDVTPAIASDAPAAAAAQLGAKDVQRLFPGFQGAPLSTLFAPVL
jgi:hypothetical protein